MLSLIASTGGPIAYLGNSVTGQKHGYRPSLHKLLEGHAGMQLPAINAAFGGVGSLATLCAMERLALRHRPRVCFVECFTGDIGVGHHALTAAAVESILLRLLRADVIPVVLLLPRKGMDQPWGLELATLYRSLAKRHRVPLVDLLDRHEDPAFQLRDGVHTTEVSSQAYASATIEAMAAQTFDPASQVSSHEIDLSGAGERNPSEFMPRRARDGLFRMQVPYWTLKQGEKAEVLLGAESLLGLLFIVGPDSGILAVDGQQVELRDKWSDYHRIHALMFDVPKAASEPVRLEAAECDFRLASLLACPGL